MHGKSGARRSVPVQEVACPFVGRALRLPSWRTARQPKRSPYNPELPSKIAAVAAVAAGAAADPWTGTLRRAPCCLSVGRVDARKIRGTTERARPGSSLPVCRAALRLPSWRTTRQPKRSPYNPELPSKIAAAAPGAAGAAAIPGRARSVVPLAVCSLGASMHGQSGARRSVPVQEVACQFVGRALRLPSWRTTRQPKRSPYNPEPSSKIDGSPGCPGEPSSFQATIGCSRRRRRRSRRCWGSNPSWPRPVWLFRRATHRPTPQPRWQSQVSVFSLVSHLLPNFSRGAAE